PLILFTSGRHGEENIYSTAPLNGDVTLIAPSADFSDLHAIKAIPAKGKFRADVGSFRVTASRMMVDSPPEVVVTGVSGAAAEDSGSCHESDPLDCLPVMGTASMPITH